MIGYHFTSYRNWLNIKEQGLKLYPINHSELDKYFPNHIEGIWTWAEKPVGESLLGSIFYQIGVKQSTHVVLLEFDYDEENLLHTATGNLVSLYHDGILGGWLYHKDSLAYIVTTEILPESIRLTNDFNLMDLIKG